jgi:hypothetical protein
MLTTTAATLRVDAITANPASKNINAGQGVTFTAATSNPTGTDTVQWQVSTDGGATFNPLADGGVYSGTTTTTLTISNAPTALNSDQYLAVFTNAAGTLMTSAATLGVNHLDTTTTVSSSNATSSYGQSVTFTATVSAAAGTPGGTVSFLDNGYVIGSAPLTGGKATFLTALLGVGTHNITAVYGGDTNDLGSHGSTVQTVKAAVYILNATAGGALSLSGNAELEGVDLLQVNSSSSTAVQLSGNADVNAATIDIAGGDQVSGHARFDEKPVTHAASTGDPLATLVAPTGGTSQGAINFSSGIHLLPAGVYSSITVTGSAQLILGAGVFQIGAGGITISGNARVTGNDVLLYNSGALTLGGNAVVDVTAMAYGPYAGIAIFQARNNANAVTVSGNANLNLEGGVLYAANPQCLVTFSGNAKVDATLLVNELTITGNAALDDQ